MRSCDWGSGGALPICRSCVCVGGTLLNKPRSEHSAPRLLFYAGGNCMNCLGYLLSSRARRGLALAVLAFGIPLTANANVTARNAGGIYDPVTLDRKSTRLNSSH